MNDGYLTRFAPIFLGIIALWIIVSGLLSDVIDVDAAQYAAISMEMLLNDRFLQVFERGKDYLDKPPLLFWLNAASFKVFGLHNFAYKLPTLLFSALGLIYTYRLGKLLYNSSIGRLSALFVGTSIGFIWANNDVKTDAIMVSCIVFSVYYLILFMERSTWRDLIAGSIGIGLGLLAKGPMGLVFPFAIVFFYALFYRKIPAFFRPKWMLLPFVVALLLAPMLWGLYQQFDLQPDKVVHGKTAVSGLRFFFWEQSFGRITGENDWKNDTSFFYLFHSLLLLIFPFSLLTVWAYFRKIKRGLQRRDWQDLVLPLGSLLILTALSLSSYKIPHYTLVIFPFVAIVIASELHPLLQVGSSKWLMFHNVGIAVLVFLVGLVGFMCFNFPWVQLLPFLLLFVMQVWYLRQTKHALALCTSALTLGFVFNTYLLPSAQVYTQGRMFAALIEEQDLNEVPLYFYNRSSNAIEFYLHRRIEVVSGQSIVAGPQEQAWYYMSEDGRQGLLEAGLQIEEEFRLMQYDLNRVNLLFLNPITRPQALSPRCLVKFKPL